VKGKTAGRRVGDGVVDLKEKLNFCKNKKNQEKVPQA
jgi:hypothetical protein